MKNRVDIIAEAVRSYGVKGKGVDASELAEWIDAAIRDIDDQNFCDGYDMGYKEGYSEGLDDERA